MLPKKLKGWRTITANLLMSVLPASETLRFGVDSEGALISAYTLFVIITNLLLRMITNGPVGKR